MVDKERKPNLPNTYVVQDLQGQREIERLKVQDTMFTAGMGGALAEQENPRLLKRVLDIGCGTGGWLIETAKTYPEIKELFGVDVNRPLIEYAQSQAQAEGLTDRVTFQVMDATMMLRYPQSFFDLINMRVGSSFLRTWDWAAVVTEMLRVAKAQAILRVTDASLDVHSNSPALTEFLTRFTNAFYKSGHLFEASPTSLIDHLPDMLHQYGCANVQTKIYTIDCSAGTPAGQAYYKDVEHLVYTIKPFLQKWGEAGKDGDKLSHQVLVEMQQPGFQATFTLLTAWGLKDEQSKKGSMIS